MLEEITLSCSSLPVEEQAERPDVPAFTGVWELHFNAYVARNLRGRHFSKVTRQSLSGRDVEVKFSSSHPDGEVVYSWKTLATLRVPICVSQECIRFKVYLHVIRTNNKQSERYTYLWLPEKNCGHLLHNDWRQILESIYTVTPSNSIQESKIPHSNHEWWWIQHTNKFVQVHSPSKPQLRKWNQLFLKLLPLSPCRTNVTPVNKHISPVKNFVETPETNESEKWESLPRPKGAKPAGVFMSIALIVCRLGFDFLGTAGYKRSREAVGIPDKRMHRDRLPRPAKNSAIWNSISWRHQERSRSFESFMLFHMVAWGCMVDQHVSTHCRI